MRRALKVCLPLLILVVSCLLYLVAYSQVDIGMRPETHNFGVVREGAEVKHVFTIGNPSLRVVEIAGIRATCACVLPTEKPRQIKPLSRCKIPITLRTIGKSGVVDQKVLVDLQGLPPVVLALHGTVVMDVPKTLEFPKVRRGQTEQREFLLNTYPGVDLAVDRLEYDHKYFDVSYSADDRNSRNFKFIVTLSKEIEFGPFEKVLVICTNDPIAPTKRVTIRGYVMKTIEARTTTLAFGVIAPGTEKAAQIKVFSPYGNEIKIERLECSRTDRVKWEVVNDAEDRTSVTVGVTLTIPLDARTAIVNDELHLYGRAGGPLVRTDLSVSALIRARPAVVAETEKPHPQ
jgi:hypothetical protein